MAIALRDRTEVRFRAMGTDIVVVGVDASSDLIDEVPAMVERLEAQWSRFRPESELCRLNGSSGAPVVVSEDLFAVIERAVLGWRVTNGRYDPTVLDAVVAAGYDRDFDAVEREGESVEPTQAAPGCEGIELDRVVGSVLLPPGVALDLGGIGKGYAADLIAHELIDDGAAGVLVSLGGDARALGAPPRSEGWSIEIDDPFHVEGGDRGGDDLRRVRLQEGAVATSSRMRRAWSRGGVPMHHLIDPATGGPVSSGLASVTVIAAEAWYAEILSKAAFVAGLEGAVHVLGDAGVTGVLVSDDRTVFECAGIEAFR
ncbi:MAG: FAD:protein FMN transferase [Acidimicrobiia bacterium]|nr:FAD:protein FMN transferase [Acidimicrobiia bacterium]